MSKDYFESFLFERVWHFTRETKADSAREFMRIIRFLQNIVRSSTKKHEEDEFQRKEGYSISYEVHGPDQYLKYCAGDQEARIDCGFKLFSDVSLYINSFRTWTKPSGEPLSDEEFELVLNRVTRYLSRWGRVLIDKTPYFTLEQVKERLSADGVTFEEIDGVIQYKTTAEQVRQNLSEKGTTY